MRDVRRLFLSTDEHWLRELELVGADPGTWGRLARKSSVSVYSVSRMPYAAANILKQCMLSGGADAIVAHDSVSCGAGTTRALVVGTPKHILQGCGSLRGQPFGLSELSLIIERALMNPPPLPASISAGRKTLDFSNGPLIMGILNVTPDSFSDGGRYLDRECALEHARQMVLQGADIIDIGAESTRPGAEPVPSALQISRLLAVVPELAESIEAVLSVDTTSAEVARAAIDAGAEMLNDVTALSDPEMAETAARTGVPIILMHMKGTPRTMQQKPSYDDVMEEVYGFLEERVRLAEDSGVPRDRIIVDPGIGFGKRHEDNLMLVSRVAEFRWLGCRVMLGHSRKSFLGEITGLDRPSDRDAGTHAVTALSSGCADIFRVHDVEGTGQVLRVAAELRSGA